MQKNSKQTAQEARREWSLDVVLSGVNFASNIVFTIKNFITKKGVNTSFGLNQWMTDRSIEINFQFRATLFDE